VHRRGARHRAVAGACDVTLTSRCADQDGRRLSRLLPMKLSTVFAPLVDRLVAQARDSPIGLGAGRAYLQYLHNAAQGVAGAHRRQPAKFVQAWRADTRLAEDARLDEQPEADGDGLESRWRSARHRATRRRRSHPGERAGGHSGRRKSMISASVRVRPPLVKRSPTIRSSR
jgi:hypothetical protein